MSQTHFKFSLSVIVVPLLLLFSIWLVFWYQVRVDSGIRYYGIHPQEIKGLLGVFTSPFLHGDIQHIYNNSIPLFVLSLALFYFYKPIAWKVLGFGVLLSGSLTWLIADQGNHIGASGLIYVLVSFIFFKGIFAKHFRLIALSLVVVFLYGSLIWYVFPIKQGMSWEGHLSGLISGFIFALIFKKHIPKRETYRWEAEDFTEEDDPFMRQFDEDGNFIDFKDLPENKAPIENDLEEKRINYIYKQNDD